MNEENEEATERIEHRFLHLPERLCQEDGCLAIIRRKIVVNVKTLLTDKGKSPAEYRSFNRCVQCAAERVARKLALRAQVRIVKGTPGWQERTGAIKTATS